MSVIFFAQQLITGNQLPQTDASPDTLKIGFRDLYEIIGAVAILLLVIGALRYVIAGGDANKIAETKRMIAYTLVGLLVVALAATIIEFVLKAK